MSGGGTRTVPADTYDAFGRRNTPNYAAIGNSDQLLAAIPGLFKGATGALNTAGGAVASNIAKTASGDYLNGSPVFNKGISSILGQAGRTAADQNSMIRSRFARAGTTWGTANQQAQDADTASTMANAQDTAARAWASNYQTERGYQNQTPTALSALTQAYMNPAYYGALANNAAAGGPVSLMQPTMMQKPGIMDYLSQAMKIAGPVAGMAFGGPPGAAAGGAASNLFGSWM